MIKFTHNNKLYALEFQRNIRPLPDKAVRNPLVTVNRPSCTHPHTTVRVVELDPKNKDHRYLWREATVGCWHKEAKFTKEGGRVAALRKVAKTPGIAEDLDFRNTMWKAYHNRNKTPDFIEGEVISSEVVEDHKELVAELVASESLGG